jgi:hypothetical protein
MTEINKRNNMIVGGLTERLVAVKNSWGLAGVDVCMYPNRNVSGYTDFKKIVVNYDNRLVGNVVTFRGEVIGDAPTLPKMTDVELRNIAAEARGIFYHEVGHNLFTVPLPDLLSLAKDSGVAIPHTFAHVVHPENRANSADPSKDLWDIHRGFKRAWNILEDQRMEMSLMDESPYLANYLTVTVLRLILGSNNTLGSEWALVAGRDYLPDSVRQKARDDWDRNLTSRYTSATADEVQDVVQTYCTAKDVGTMIECILEMISMTDSMDIQPTNPHDGLGRSDSTSSGKKDDAEGLVREAGEKAANAQASKKDPKPSKGTSVSKSDEDDENESDDEGDGSGGDSDEGVDSDVNGSGCSNKGQSSPPQEYHTLREETREALENALDNLKDDKTLTDDVASINDTYNGDEGMLGIHEKITTNEDEEAIAKASKIIAGIEEAFRLATQDCAPQWEGQQRRGVLEPIRYRTRQPGDIEVFRNMNDSGNPGTDIAVSLFLDISGSMFGTGESLGAAAWAVKTACQNLEIECDVTLFDEGAYKMWSTVDSPTFIPNIGSGGCTDPTLAFEAILSEERNKKHHLVMVLTDGEWGEVVMGDYRHANTRSAVFFYNNGFPESRPNYRRAMNLRADEGYDIKDLMDIPQALESMLLSLV